MSRSGAGRAAGRVAMLTPLPPARTGVAHYVSILLPALREQVDVEAFDSSEGYRRAEFDQVIYQLGNNPHHEFAYREAIREPGIVVLHDLVLHHLIVEMTLARGNSGEYVRMLEANHGPAGAAWAAGRAAGLHTELGNFLLPGSVEVAQRSVAVIVHNRYAAARLRSFGVTTPIHVVPHPWVPEAGEPSTLAATRAATRARYGFAENDRVIGLFGFLTAAKRADVVLEAFTAAFQRNSHLRLLIVGEPAPDIDRTALDREGIVTTGYVPDEDFAKFYAAADRLVNLRYPSAGETSGTLIRAFDAGKPVAVSDYAQFAELPPDCVYRVPLGAGEREKLAEFFLADLADPAAAQRAWLEGSATAKQTAEGYVAALRDAGQRVEIDAVSPALPLFPQFDATVSARDGGLTLRVVNAGTGTIRTSVYGQPEYRLVVKLFAGERELHDRWLTLPSDLQPGGTAELTIALPSPRSWPDVLEVRLYHALQDVLAVDERPWVTFEVPNVR